MASDESSRTPPDAATWNMPCAFVGRLPARRIALTVLARPEILRCYGDAQQRAGKNALCIAPPRPAPHDQKRGEFPHELATFVRTKYPHTRSSSSRHPPFTHHPFPLSSLVCCGQPSPHKPRLVVSHSTCPPLSSSPHAHSFVIGTAVINTHTHTL